MPQHRFKYSYRQDVSSQVTSAAALVCTRQKMDEMFEVIFISFSKNIYKSLCGPQEFVTHSQVMLFSNKANHLFHRKPE